jgi:hypothetical protein
MVVLLRYGFSPVGLQHHYHTRRQRCPRIFRIKIHQQRCGARWAECSGRRAGRDRIEVVEDQDLVGLGERLVSVGGVVAVVLGGSRARGLRAAAGPLRRCLAHRRGSPSSLLGVIGASQQQIMQTVTRAEGLVAEVRAVVGDRPG